MTIKERKEELKKEFNASAEEFVKNYKVFERVGFELDDLKKNRQAAFLQRISQRSRKNIAVYPRLCAHQ